VSQRACWIKVQKIKECIGSSALANNEDELDDGGIEKRPEKRSEKKWNKNNDEWNEGATTGGTKASRNKMEATRIDLKGKEGKLPWTR
jgi:hypothetical protein